jgi:hypothetical protein
MHHLVVGFVTLAHAQDKDLGQEPDETEEGRSRPVGGSLAGWGAVPIASDTERAEGLTHLWGQLQVWATVWDQDVDPQADPATYGDPEADPGFSIHRGRLGFDGYVPMGEGKGRHQVDYALSVGIAAPDDVLQESDTDVQLVDGFGRWALPYSAGTSSLALGLQRVPFSREAMMSSADLVFQEGAPGTNWLAPARGVGALAAQSFRFAQGEDAAQVLVRLGAFNNDGDLFGSQGPGLLASARAELVMGETYRTWSPRKKPALGIGAAALRDADVSTLGTGFEADLIARYSLFTVMGELVSSKISPTDTTVQDPVLVASTNRLGWLGQLSVWIPAPLGGREASGIEVAARYSSFDDATALDNNGDVQLLHAGATWRNLLPRTDLGAGFIHREEPDGVPNDTIRIWTQVRPEGRF